MMILIFLFLIIISYILYKKLGGGGILRNHYELPTYDVRKIKTEIKIKYHEINNKHIYNELLKVFKKYGIKYNSDGGDYKNLITSDMLYIDNIYKYTEKDIKNLIGAHEILIIGGFNMINNMDAIMLDKYFKLKKYGIPKHYGNYLYVDNLLEYYTCIMNLFTHNSVGESMMVYKKSKYKNLLRIYNTQYRFYNYFKLKQLDELLLYFKIHLNFNDNTVYLIKNFLKKKCNDRCVYEIIKKNMNPGVINTRSGKISRLLNMLENHKIASVLDVGTEQLSFLDELELKLGCNAHGVNIDAGFCHYPGFNSKTDKRFRLYDGKTLPFEAGEFELVTVFSVVHHVDSKKLYKFLCEISRITSKFIFIKDVDLITKKYGDFFNIQHEIYEDLFLKDRSYKNSCIKYSEIEYGLGLCGFKMYKIDRVNNFNNSFYALFVKNDIHL